MKLITGLVLAAFISSLVPALTHADGGEKRQLLVTAYYSPLPDQRFYIRGSYEADIRLNGRGTNGADGTEVYVGMLAAPKTYKFGTRVNIPGLGMGVVHDRGGAIVMAKNYDRIDVWMGRGEEGLARALHWGARLVEGEIFTDSAIEPQLDYSWLPTQLPKALLSRPQTPNVSAVPKADITPASSAEEIKELQMALTTLGFYSGDISGNYDASTTDAVRNFQLINNLIGDPKDPFAGKFGPKTSALLKQQLADYDREVIKEQERIKANQELLSFGLGKNSKGDAVYTLQQILWELGYYAGDLTGAYDKNTTNAVFEFQKTHGLVKSEWEKGAGFFGQQTHKALIAALDVKIEKIKDYPKAIRSWLPEDRPLPDFASMHFSEQEKQTLAFEASIMNTKVVQQEVSGGLILSRLMKEGDEGEDIKAVQQFLISQKLLAAGNDTGMFGPKTAAAVAKFQLQEGLIKDFNDYAAGNIGPKTAEKLVEKANASK